MASPKILPVLRLYANTVDTVPGYGEYPTDAFSASVRMVSPSLWHAQLWHHAWVADETISEKLRRESDELLRVANKLMEHSTKLIAQALELEKQMTRQQRDSQKGKKP